MPCRYRPAARPELSKRKGRALTVIREPSGRLSRSTEDAIDAVAPAVAKRLRDASARGVADAMWGTEVGRLFLEAKITAPEFEAGRRWGRMVAEWHRAVGAPYPYPGPGPIAFLGTVRGRDGGDDPVVSSKEGKRILAARRRIIAEMQEAHGMLFGAGVSAESAVRGTCEANEIPVGVFGLDNLKRGLAWLAQYWGLINR